MNNQYKTIFVALTMFFLSSGKVYAQEPSCDCVRLEAEIKALKQQNEDLRAKLDAAERDGKRRAADRAEVERHLQELQSQGDSSRKDPVAGLDSQKTLTNKPNAADVKEQLKAVASMAKKCSHTGVLNVSFSLASKGKAEDVKSISGDLVGTPAEKCILTILRNYPFTPFEGEPIPVKYPFRF